MQTAELFAPRRPVEEKTLRPYQRRAVNSIMQLWRDGVSRVVLVGPTGAGKSVMGAEVIRRARVAGARVQVIAHRTELVDQMRDHLGDEARDGGPVNVATVQTLRRRDIQIAADLVVIDEAHHYAAEDWRQVLPAAGVRVLGMTATPSRSDGKPLGNYFDELVVAAQYPELVESGDLVPCRVFRPKEYIGPDLARDVVEAYVDHCNGEQAFVFCRSIPHAHELAEQFGDGARVVSHETPKAERAESLQLFKLGRVRVLCNVHVLTEGVDVPAASCCILARGCGHPSTFLQMVGRVLRPSLGKERATLIDLVGATHLHGMPTERRRYSLERGIEREEVGALKVCPSCGYTLVSAAPECDRCGHVFEAEPRKRPRIYNLELEEVFDFEDTPVTAKLREYSRLRATADERGFGLYWVIREYEKLFGSKPVLHDVGADERRVELGRLMAHGQSRGYKPGWASYRYKATFGNFPPRMWM